MRIALFLLSITSPDKIPAILGKSCEFFCKVQHKSLQAPLSQTNTLQSFFCAGTGSQREEGGQEVAQLEGKGRGGGEQSGGETAP